jgi:hypothetical protein
MTSTNHQITSSSKNHNINSFLIKCHDYTLPPSLLHTHPREKGAANGEKKQVSRSMHGRRRGIVMSGSCDWRLYSKIRYLAALFTSIIYSLSIHLLWLSSGSLLLLQQQQERAASSRRLFSLILPNLQHSVNILE